jgi:hypothetical protein
MKKKIFLAAICMVLVSASLCLALPDYTISVGPNHESSFSGGPFTITGNGYNFDTFCVETGEFQNYGTLKGSIDSVVLYGTASGHTIVANSGVAITSKTIGLYDYYLDNESSLNATQTEQIQQAIWWFQGQSADPGNIYSDGNYTGTVRNIMALNLWSSDTESAATAQQSMLIPVTTTTTSVPEPSMLILLGLGLGGLAGVRRKFKN